MNRRPIIQFILSLAVALGALGMSGLAQAGAMDFLKGMLGHDPRQRLIVIQIDVTGSISEQDWQLYEQAYGQVINNLQPGDRVVVSAIGDKPASRFVSIRDESVPKSEGIRLKDDAAIRKLREHLKTDFSQLRTQSAQSVRATCILDAISAAEQVFAQGRAQQRELVYLVLSDMVEESPIANFAKKRVDEAMTARLLEGRRKGGLLPNLAEVEVYVVGAGGKNGEQMVRIHQFWSAYFEATQARLRAYGRTPVALLEGGAK